MALWQSHQRHLVGLPVSEFPLLAQTQVLVTKASCKGTGTWACHEMVWVKYHRLPLLSFLYN